MTNDKLARLIASAFGLGYAKKAPGTVASAYTAAIVFILQQYGGLWMVMAFLGISILLSLWSAEQVLKSDPTLSDPSWIVMDEVAGQTLAMLYIFETGNIWYALIAFAAFRLFDIVKPWPVSWADKKVGGSLGILLDDIFAGIMAGIVVFAIQIWLPL